MRRDDSIEFTGDMLSTAALELVNLNAASACRRLVVRDRPNEHVRDRLAAVEPAGLVPRPLRDMESARGLLAGLWLWHDFLDEAHRIAQQIATPTGSFWHAIMHRREGDFDNSKYWYARCAGHGVIQFMAPRAAELVHPLPADKALLRLIRDSWDPAAFVDLVAAVHDKPDDPRHELAIRLQQAEWRLLFDHCAREAV